MEMQRPQQGSPDEYLLRGRQYRQGWQICYCLFEKQGMGKNRQEGDLSILKDYINKNSLSSRWISARIKKQYHPLSTMT